MPCVPFDARPFGPRLFCHRSQAGFQQLIWFKSLPYIIYELALAFSQQPCESFGSKQPWLFLVPFWAGSYADLENQQKSSEGLAFNALCTAGPVLFDTRPLGSFLFCHRSQGSRN